MRFQTLLLIPFATAAIYACSGSEEQPVGPPKGYEDVLLEGLVTDETLVSFVQALGAGPPADKPTQAAVVFWPANNEKLLRDPPQSFCWRFGDTADREVPPRDGRWASLEPFVLAAPAGLTSPLRELFGPPRGAMAHGDPYSGVATYLVFSTATDPRLLRVLTSDVTFVPTQQIWDKLAGTGEPITLKLVTSVLDHDRIPAGEGLVAGTSMQFSISQ